MYVKWIMSRSHKKENQFFFFSTFSFAKTYFLSIPFVLWSAILEKGENKFVVMWFLSWELELDMQ